MVLTQIGDDRPDPTRGLDGKPSTFGGLSKNRAGDSEVGLDTKEDREKSERLASAPALASAAVAFLDTALAADLDLRLPPPRSHSPVPGPGARVDRRGYAGIVELFRKLAVRERRRGAGVSSETSGGVEERYTAEPRSEYTDCPRGPVLALPDVLKAAAGTRKVTGAEVAVIGASLLSAISYFSRSLLSSFRKTTGVKSMPSRASVT